MRVQQVGEEYRIVVSKEAMDALHLTNGSEVELHPVADSNPESGPVVGYTPREEVFEAYRATLPQHEAAYKELAK